MDKEFANKYIKKSTHANDATIANKTHIYPELVKRHSVLEDMLIDTFHCIIAADRSRNIYHNLDQYFPLCFIHYSSVNIEHEITVSVDVLYSLYASYYKNNFAGIYGSDYKMEDAYNFIKCNIPELRSEEFFNSCCRYFYPPYSFRIEKQEYIDPWFDNYGLFSSHPVFAQEPEFN